MGSVLMKLFFKEKGKDYGSNRSIVRRLGSVFPLKPSCRICLPNDAVQPVDGGGDFIYGTQTPNVSVSERFTPKAQRTLNYEEFVALVQGMNVMEGLMYKMLNRIQHLEDTLDALNVSFSDKLQTIEEQVNTMFINLQTKDLSSVNTKMLQECKTPLPPPSPPPLPPPLPPTLLASFCTPPTQIIRHIKSEQKNPNRGIMREKTRLSLAEIIKDIHSVKLRPVARSPGGNPVRQQPVSDDPSSILTDAIKKKFAALHQEGSPVKETMEKDFTLKTE